MGKNKTRKELLYEIQALGARLEEAEETLRAIRSGEVDALVVSGEQGDQVFTLKGAEQPYRALIEKMKEGAVTLASDNTILYCNEGFARMLKMPLEKVIGTGIANFVQSTDRALLEELLQRGRAEGSKGEISLMAGSGTPVQACLSINAFEIDNVSAAYLVAMDITEKKKLESHLLRAQRLESIGTLAGGIAHDLNNVLTPIMLSLEMLKRKATDEKSRKLLATLEQSTKGGADLIRQVLTFARGIEGERLPVRITHIISEIEKIAKQTFPKNIEILIDVPEEPWSVSGDSTQLQQVLMNMCVNARDAMQEGGSLSISVENFFIDVNYASLRPEAKTGRYVVIEVSDNGTGIPPEILDKIFEPFFTTKEQGRSTGLGLSTALAIVKSHGGFINVYSEVGKGTTFKVYLPAISPGIQGIEEQRPELPEGHGEYILVAEDEDTIREITLSILETHGYKVLPASDGKEAAALYARNKDKIRVVLMDMMMPVMNGKESIQAIHGINPDARIIAVSGLAENGKHGKNLHLSAFLSKPYTAERLLKAIDDVIKAK